MNEFQELLLCDESAINNCLLIGGYVQVYNYLVARYAGELMVKVLMIKHTF